MRIGIYLTEKEAQIVLRSIKAAVNEGAIRGTEMDAAQGIVTALAVFAKNHPRAERAEATGVIVCETHAAIAHWRKFEGRS